ncbi:hypothetical protein HPP92_007099 [Vanilla planifolia]|uniref:Uncharacterized protein n=1 Tax=Vanilla planifolia TaxID=51239 RepID=A0A835RCH3_VANPL|nr:hypothetical protein HPP92_007350 [Vanilla planifolia]KAG0490236.1 hypothetical protein HPP92_007099 [Vanilla planifolia]
MGVAPAVAVFSSKIHPRSVHRHPGGNFERGGERLGVGCYKGGGSWGRQTLAFNSLNHLKFSPRTSSKLEFVQRTSIDEVRKEMQNCYELIQRLGRGVVYFGSSRLNDDHPHFLQAIEFARDVAKLLECTTWTGAGPGLMDAAIKGALEARMPVGGLKIAMEASEGVSSNQHPYLPSEKYLTCRFISARKYGLANAVARNEPSDMTAVVAFPAASEP